MILPQTIFIVLISQGIPLPQNTISDFMKFQFFPQNMPN